MTAISTIQERIKSELVFSIQVYDALDVELRDSLSTSNETAWSLPENVATVKQKTFQKLHLIGSLEYFTTSSLSTIS